MYFATGLYDTQWGGQFEGERYWRWHSSPHGTCQCLCWHAGLSCTSSWLNPETEGEIWQVAFKSRPLGNTASLTGPAEGPSLAHIQEERGRTSSAAPSCYRLPSTYPLLSLEYYAKSALCSRLPLTHQMCARQPVFQTEIRGEREQQEQRRGVKRRWHSVTIRTATWWRGCCSHLSPFRFPISSTALNKQPKNPEQNQV